MARRTEPATTAGKCQQVLIMAIGTTNSCESLFEVATFKICPNNIGNYLPVKAIILCKSVIINLFKMIEMIFSL